MGAHLLAYAGIPSFMRLPVSRALSGVDVAIVGVPYDSGAVSYRSGARLGPRALRAASPLLWGYHRGHGLAPLERLRAVDCGDIAVQPSDPSATLAAIESEMDAILISGARALCLGGDHAITLPLLRTHARRHGPLAVLHLDAHADTWPGPWDHATALGQAAQEGLIAPGAWAQVGIRGPLWGPQDVGASQRLGARLWTADDCHALPPAELAAQVRATLAGHPLYITLDLDVFDPAYAPGVGTPEVGGLTSHQGLHLLRALAGLPLVGADIVELCPPYDAGEITAILGANLAFELLALMALT